MQHIYPNNYLGLILFFITTFSVLNCLYSGDEKNITQVGSYVTISVFSTFRQVKHKIKRG